MKELPFFYKNSVQTRIMGLHGNSKYFKTKELLMKEEYEKYHFMTKLFVK